jgi:hypothetical protein
MSDKDKALAELKKFLAENPGSGEAVAKLIFAIIALTYYMKIYSGIVVYQLIDYLRKKLGGILARSKSVKVEDVENSILFFYRCF